MNEEKKKLLLFLAKSLDCERAVNDFESVCKRFELDHEVIFIEDKHWMFPTYNVCGVPTLVLAKGQEVIKSTVGVFSATAFEATLREWGFEY